MLLARRASSHPRLVCTRSFSSQPIHNTLHRFFHILDRLEPIEGGALLGGLRRLARREAEETLLGPRPLIRRPPRRARRARAAALPLHKAPEALLRPQPPVRPPPRGRVHDRRLRRGERDARAGGVGVRAHEDLRRAADGGWAALAGRQRRRRVGAATRLKRDHTRSTRAAPTAMRATANASGAAQTSLNLHFAAGVFSRTRQKRLSAATRWPRRLRARE